MPERKSIYVIGVFEKLEQDPKTKLPDFGSGSIPGWYSKKEDAMKAVTENACDINETCYDYAVIEEIEEGLYNPAPFSARWLYKYNRQTGKYEPIEEPKILKHTCGLTIN